MISVTRTNRLNVLLLAHDLSDAAIAKRIQMLCEGGASVTVAGFRRTQHPITNLAGCLTVDFGKTRNGGFAQRILAVLRTLLNLKSHQALFAAADVIIGRNLEMLAIAVAGSAQQKQKAVVIYEILDIHRLLLGSTTLSRGIRWLERTLLKQAHAIFTSSPAFITHYFQKINPTRLPIRLIENRLLKYALHPPLTEPSNLAHPPWVIGWFGIIRCRKSLHILADLVRQSAGKVVVIIRGRPALDQIPEFHDLIAATPGLKFEGSYESPKDLASMYNAVHFNWAIDMYEEGLNSSWLLPNRIYEGGYFGAVPIALKDVETGRYLRNLGIGVLLPVPSAPALNNFLSHLPTETYQQLAKAAQTIPTSQWVYEKNDCLAVVNFMTDLKLSIQGTPHE